MSIPANRTDGRKFFFEGAAEELGFIPLTQSTLEELPVDTASSVIFKGFSIELLNFGYSLSVQDTFLNTVPGARVFVTDLTDFLEEGSTDGRGNYYGNAEQGTTYVVTVMKEGFFNYVHRFRIVPAGSLSFPLKNFPVLVRNASDAPVSGAQVVITAPSHTDSGTTGADGLYEGTVRAGSVNTIVISKSGFTTYNHSIEPYIRITPAQQNLVAVPVVVLS